VIVRLPCCRIAAELKTAGSAEAAALRRRTRGSFGPSSRNPAAAGGDGGRLCAAAPVVSMRPMAWPWTRSSISSRPPRSPARNHLPLARPCCPSSLARRGGRRTGPTQADAALRSRSAAAAGWTLADPIPYARRCNACAGRAAPAAAHGSPRHRADRLVAMALEVGTLRSPCGGDRVVAEGRLRGFSTPLGRPADSAALTCERRSPRRLPCSRSSPRLRLQSCWSGSCRSWVRQRRHPNSTPSRCESRGAWRGLLAQLAKMGAEIGQSWSRGSTTAAGT